MIGVALSEKVEYYIKANGPKLCCDGMELCRLREYVVCWLLRYKGERRGREEVGTLFSEGKI
jgi:hypothetical protein